VKNLVLYIAKPSASGVKCALCEWAMEWCQNPALDLDVEVRYAEDWGRDALADRGPGGAGSRINHASAGYYLRHDEHPVETPWLLNLRFWAIEMERADFEELWESAEKTAALAAEKGAK